MRFNITMFVGILTGIALTLWVFIPLVLERNLSPEWKTMLTAIWAFTIASVVLWLAMKAQDIDFKK